MQSSEVLVIGAPKRRDGKDFGAQFVTTFGEARTYLQSHRAAVLVFGHTRNGEFARFCEYARTELPESLWIVSSEGLAPSTLIECNNHGRLHALIEGFEDPEFEPIVRGALEASGEAQQKRQLVDLFEDQRSRLERLSAELESRVERRHKTLRKSLRKTEATKTLMETFHKALLGVHRASTVLQMEQTLNEALHGTIGIQWVRVRFEAQSSLRAANASHVLAIELPYHYEKMRGEVLFAKSEGQQFTSDEADFLQELSEALGLALSRLHKLEQAETLKGQWQATFDAISHPLCLVNEDFEVLKLNRAFREQAKNNGDFQSLLGKKCFPVFFGHDFQPPNRLESPFSFRQPRSGRSGTEHFEVIGQPLQIPHGNQNVQLILLRAITDEVRFERRILDASKLAELGTIGSSIAHELNNPLGGMLSFLQLILMDLKSSDPIHTEIKAMEEAVLRCRDIVLNLLSFARKQDLGEFTEIDLWEVLEKAIKVVALQSKSMGVQIGYRRGPPAPIKGSANALAQAFCNLLQNAIDAIAERSKENLKLEGQIQIELQPDNQTFRLTISDNGTGIRPEVQSQIFNPHFTTRDPDKYSGMGLNNAFTIVQEHGGKLEMLSQSGTGSTAVIILPRLNAPR